MGKATDVIQQVEEIVAHLGAALIQVTSKDDAIITAHMADAHAIAVKVLRELRQSERAA